MSADFGTFSSGKPPLASQRSPEATFAKIRHEFMELGILGKNLSVEHEGVRYRVSCDEKTFMVYRINDTSGPRHHVPGWPVCLVSADIIFEECGSPGLGDDHYACGLDIDNWLKLIGQQYRGSAGS